MGLWRSSSGNHNNENRLGVSNPMALLLFLWRFLHFRRIIESNYREHCLSCPDPWVFSLVANSMSSFYCIFLNIIVHFCSHYISKMYTPLQTPTQSHPRLLLTTRCLIWIHRRIETKLGENASISMIKNPSPMSRKLWKRLKTDTQEEFLSQEKFRRKKLIFLHFPNKKTMLAGYSECSSGASHHSCSSARRAHPRYPALALLALIVHLLFFFCFFHLEQKVKFNK